VKAAFKFITTVTGLILIGLAVVGLLVIGPFSGFLAALVARDLAAIHGTTVTLADCKVRPFQQRIELQGLTINNPDPFRAGPALVVEQVDIDLDTASLLSGAPGVRRILFSGTTVHLRHEAAAGTNLGQLESNARAFTAQWRENADTGETDSGFRLNALRSEDTILRLSSDWLPALEAPLQIGEFEIENLAERGAVHRGEVVMLLIRRLLLEATGIPGIADSVARVLHGEAAGGHSP